MTQLKLLKDEATRELPVSSSVDAEIVGFCSKRARDDVEDRSVSLVSVRLLKSSWKLKHGSLRALVLKKWAYFRAWRANKQHAITAMNKMVAMTIMKIIHHFILINNQIKSKVSFDFTNEENTFGTSTHAHNGFQDNGR